ncbi:MAG: DinB family protein [Anaerolineae bacterium]
MPDNQEPKVGRPRQYGLEPLPGCADPETGLAAAALNELRERVIDQIIDLPEEALTFAPEGLNFSIASLVVHMVWAEMDWVSRIGETSPPEGLRDLVDRAGRALPAGERVIPALSADALVALCRQVRDDVTAPTLSNVDNVTRELPGEGPSATIRGVLMHVIWHWTYHSGQVGLLRELWGSGYVWTFGSMAA